MARGNATEDELSAGIRAVGVLSAVAGPEGARRDSPFATPVAPQRSPPTEVPARPATALEPRPASKPAPVRETLPEKPARAPVEAPSKEKELFTDPVTVRMTAEMRTSANGLAAELQRQRTDKTNRFTPNSVFRVAIETFLARFELTSQDHINSEEDLLRLAKIQFDAPKRVNRTRSPS